MRAGSVVGVAVAILVVSSGLFFSSAFSEAILEEDFESGTAGWLGPVSQVSSPVHSGSNAAALTVEATGPKTGLRTVTTILPNEDYMLQAWVLKNDPGIESAKLMLRWYSSADGSGAPLITVNSPDLTADDASFQSVATATLRSPAAAQSAKVGVAVTTSSSISGTAVVYFDDLTFTHVAATATPTATNTATTVPTATPTPTATNTATTVLTATPTSTQAPTSTSTPTPTATPTSAATSTPTNTAIATAPPAATASTPTATPTVTAVGELLQNPGFEGWSGGAPSGWLTHGGSPSQTTTPKHGGDYSLAFDSADYTSKWMYEVVPVTPQASCAFKGYVFNPHPSSANVFLRISWHPNVDGTGAEIASVDSEHADDTGFRLLSATGPAPSAAHSAVCKLVFVPSTGDPLTAYFDDVSFMMTAGPPPSPAPAPQPPAQPAATPTRTPTRSPSPTPTARRGGEIVVNGDFETAEGSSPSGWETYGGIFLQVSSPVRSGNFAAAFMSFTTSTKWAYQTVSVSPGKYYSFEGHVYKHDPNVDKAYLRVSWYASSDGSGTQLSYDDSPVLSNDEPRYRFLSTGPVLAPFGAHSGRMRIMLDPASAAYAVLYVDDVTLQRLDITPTPTPSATSTPTLTPTRSATPAPTVTVTSTASPTASSTPATSPTLTATVTAISSTTPSPSPSATPGPPATPTAASQPNPWFPAPISMLPIERAGVVDEGVEDEGIEDEDNVIGEEAALPESSEAARGRPLLPRTGNQLPVDLGLLGIVSVVLGLFLHRFPRL